MAELPDNLEVISGKPLADDLVALHDRLDALWERYLDHVDQYQKAQHELQKQLSSV